MDCRPSSTKNPDLWLETCPDVSRPLCETLREWITAWEPDLTESPEYLIWVGTAKRLETQQQRLAETITALPARRKWAQRKM